LPCSDCGQRGTLKQAWAVHFGEPDAPAKGQCKAAGRSAALALHGAALKAGAIKLFIAGLLAGAAVSAQAVVFTTDYDRITVLPALTGDPGDQDWRVHGVVTPVKNEGSCDASWAFAVEELLEGYHAIQAHILLSLSTQELVDCTGFGSGCGGGSPIAALRTVISRGGLTTAADYPYTARDGTCKASIGAVTIPGAGRVPPGDEVSLQNYVSLGPVLALVDDQDASFAMYRGGTYTGSCGTNPTRAVLIVGYSTDYWIVKNSIGTAWGAQGYIYMARHRNLCGIANYALAVSNDPLPPVAITIPTSGPWADALLLLSLAAVGFLRLRRQIG